MQCVVREMGGVVQRLALANQLSWKHYEGLCGHILALGVESGRIPALGVESGGCGWGDESAVMNAKKLQLLSPLLVAIGEAVEGGLGSGGTSLL